MSIEKPSIHVTPSGSPKFIRLESKYACHVCKNVLRDPMQTCCGHRLCRKCIETLFAGKTDPVECPGSEDDCPHLSRSDIIPDPGARREIRNLNVACDFEKFGCQDEIKWKDLSDHIKFCKYKPVTCPNTGCGESIPPDQMENHSKKRCKYRPKQCSFCKSYVPLVHVEKHKRDECPSVKMPCPYKCGSPELTRDELNNHKEICPMKPRECKFKVAGCSFEGVEEDLKRHLKSDTTKHMELMFQYVINAELQIKEVKKELLVVKTERDALRIQDERMKQEMTEMKSNIQKMNHLCKELKLKMVTVTERVINLEKQSENAAKKDVVERHDRDVRAMQTALTQVQAQVTQLERLSLSNGRTESAGLASAPELKRRVDMHDSQFAQLDVQMAELDLRFQILETASYDGTLMWKLRDYARRKQDAAQGRTLSLYSQPFYTHRYGYKMCARVYLNGDGMGKGSHLSLFFVVMKGEYDNLLPWPFQQKVTMTLLDQETGQCNLSDSFRPDPSSSSFRKPTTDMNVASGCPLFVSHSVLETPKYIRDDTLFVKFQVNLENLNHP